MALFLRICFAMLIVAFSSRAESLPPMVADDALDHWQSVGRVNVGGFKSRGLCTGTLIAPDTVLTAAHCVVDRKNDRTFEVDRIRFVAGWHKGGHQGTSKAAKVVIHPEYQIAKPANSAAAYTNFGVDIALITLADPLALPAYDFALTAGHLGPVEMLGYRVDRPHVLSNYQGCTALDLGLTGFGLSCDVASGTSGAPVFADGTLIGVVTARLSGLSAKAFVAGVDAWVLETMQ